MPKPAKSARPGEQASPNFALIMLKRPLRDADMQICPIHAAKDRKVVAGGHFCRRRPEKCYSRAPLRRLTLNHFTPHLERSFHHIRGIAKPALGGIDHGKTR